MAYLVDVGFPKLTAASYFSASYFLAVPGGLAAGAISDRIGRTRTYAGIAALYAIGYISLLLVHSPSHLLLLVISVVTVGVANGGASPVLAAFLTDRLQGPRLGFLLGLQNIGFGAGALSGGTCVRLAGKLHPCLHPDGSLHGRLIAYHLGHGTATPRDG